MQYVLPRPLRKTLKQSGVVCVYLFGSRAAKNTGPVSDYDIALLLRKGVPQRNYLDIQLKLLSEFSRFFHDSRIDIVILNESPPLLAMNVIEEGIILFDDNSDGRVNFETAATMRYLDRIPYERRYLQTLLKSI